jgi:hypothetical protein
VFATPLPVINSAHVILRLPEPADVEARLAIGCHAENIRAYGGSFNLEKPFCLLS